MRSVAGAVLLCAACASAAFAQGSPRSLADCDVLVRTQPEHPLSYRCHWGAARRQANWSEATRHLEDILSREPDNHRARLSLALVEGDQGRVPRAITLLEEAIAGFSRENDARGEIYGRHGLAYVLIDQGRLMEAEEVLRDGQGIAEASGEPMLLAAIRLEQGLLEQRRGDFGEAWDHYRSARSLLVAGHPVYNYILSRVLIGLGEVAQSLGRYRKALEIFRERAEFLHELGGHFDETDVRLSMAMMAHRLWRQGQMEGEEVRELAMDALRLATEVSNSWSEAGSRLLLGPFLDAEEARRDIDEVLAYALRSGQPALASQAYRHLARHLRSRGGENLEEAAGFAERAADLGRQSGDPRQVALSLLERAEIEWKRGPKEAGLAAWRAALDAIERARDLQPEDSVRARFFSDWTFAYYRLASLLLTPALPATESQSLAFEVSERRRARVLLDWLDAARAPSQLASRSETGAARAEVLSEIVAVQKVLLDPGLTRSARDEHLRRLEKLEGEERSLRERLVRENPVWAALRQTSFPSIEEVRSSLSLPMSVTPGVLPMSVTPGVPPFCPVQL